MVTFIGLNCEAKSLVLEGQYRGKDVYIQNPMNINGVGYSVNKSLVNGQVSSDDINSSAFIVDLSIYNFKIGDEIIIELLHQEGNEPIILNPESLMPLSTFEVLDLKLDRKGKLVWQTNNENGSLPFMVEQFRWNKWVKLGEIQGIGTADHNEYSFDVDLNSGKNKVRITQKDHTNVPRRSNIVTVFRDSYSPVRFIHNEPKNVIVFNENTRYEIFNEYGVLRKKGVGTNVDLFSLKKGVYFVNFDNLYDKIVIN